MKKFAFIMAAALALASCANKDAAQTEQAAQTEPAVEAAQNQCAGFEANGKVTELTDAAQLAPGTKVEKLTVVDFNAVWCGPCRQLAPVLEQMAAKYDGKAAFVSVDVDKFGQLMSDYNLGDAIPVVLFIKPDGTTEHYVGTGDLLPAEKFEALIEKNIN